MLGGLSGGLVVDGSETQFPILKDLPERFFFIKHAEPGGGREIISVNGQIEPGGGYPARRDAVLADRQYRRDPFFPFRIEGMALYVIATDGHPLSRPRKINDVSSRPRPAHRRDRDRPAGRRVPDGNASVPEHGMARPVSGPADRHRSCPPGSTGRERREAEVMRQRVAGPRWIEEVRTSADRAPAPARLFADGRPQRLHDRRPGHGRRPRRPDGEARRHGGMDRRQHRSAVSQLPHPSDRRSW